MKKIFLLVGLLFFCCYPNFANHKLTFWDIQRKGANGDGGALFNSGTNPDKWFKAASDVGIEFIRLDIKNWKGEGEDFLLGNADNFDSIPKSDLKHLINVLDIAYKYNIKIVLAMFDLPGCRTMQGKKDYRLWTDELYQKMAIDFWRKLANSLKNHPAIVGYNPLNEPHPGRNHGLYDKPISEFKNWTNEIKNTTEDLNLFNKRIVNAIREVDNKTPIILNGWMHSSIEGLQFLEPINDPLTLYAFHFYGPWEYSTFRINKNRYSYPNKMPVEGIKNKTEKWTNTHISNLFKPVTEWAEKHNIPTKRIIAEEFRVDRRVGGAQKFLKETIANLNQQNWHWAFYSFRSSNWDGMDYELGTEKLHWSYWDNINTGKQHEDLIDRKDNPLWNIIKKEFNQQSY